MDFVEKMLDIRVGMDLLQYTEALNEERRKIQVFQRELPLCLELVTQAIESCRQQLSGTTTEGGESDSSDRVSTKGPVLEEFIPIKTVSSSHFDNQEEEQSQNENKELGRSDWLKTAQLWNQTPDPPVKEDVLGEVNKNGGAFQPFLKDEALVKTKATGSVGKQVAPVAEATTSSTAETVSGGSRKLKEDSPVTLRKNRRCWSSELHRRFLHALQQLGGSHVATPKQIRELMKVDGLTNDEVKSHLQKYRLHTRRPSSAVQNNGVSSAPPKFVVVGSIWVPPPTTVSGEGGIYAPVGKTQRVRKTTSDEWEERDGGGVVRSNSPATPSSTHTAVTFPAA